MLNHLFDILSHPNKDAVLVSFCCYIDFHSNIHHYSPYNVVCCTSAFYLHIHMVSLCWYYILPHAI